MTEFCKNLPRTNPLLFSLICRFNSVIAADIRANQIATDVPSELVERIRSSPRGLRKLSQAIANRHSLSPAGFFDFEPRHRRFALLNVATLDALARFTTAAVHRRPIARVITRDERSHVTTLLGDDAYLFAIKRSEFLLGDQPEELVVSDIEWTEQLKSPFSCFASCLAGDPEQLTNRFRLKLPSQGINPVDIDFSRSRTEARSDLMARVMTRILLSEIAPELKPCFN